MDHYEKAFKSKGFETLRKDYNPFSTPFYD